MKKTDLVIRFSGLKDGLHEFDFEIKDTFFEQLDYSEVSKADLKVAVQFEKRTNMLILNFEIEGAVEIMCDKCTDDFKIQINTEEEVIYKFGEGVSDDEKIIIIGENEIEIDVSQPIYELTILAIPSRRVHPDGECNKEMLKAMDEYLMVESEEADEPKQLEAEPSDDENVDNEEIDPRWSELKKLKK